MMPTQMKSLRPAASAALVGFFLLGCLAIAYGWWLRPLSEAERALAAGRAAEALELYGAAERRFGRFGATRVLFAGPHAMAVENQLALLYRRGDFDSVLEKAAAAPPSAAPRFWSGLALIGLALGEAKPETQIVWFTRAEEELRQALQAAPNDWDTKVNYEIAARLVAELRKQPKKKIDTPMQLLRPQPTQGPPPRKVG